ncbi:nucleotidyltransferase domain-containing protein [Priestia koreensis]|uniref:nucleotidyltransferase domain-containing protein n=1 Tax=Priestia koreensis TaxID=284581 RepID=UPI001F59CA9E|nr:nucleotidyltransferase domain-containing protein [Priestia koreensis]UNL83298.1 DUF4111 domain-containing protein [Priestia koreensis]
MEKQLLQKNPHDVVQDLTDYIKKLVKKDFVGLYVHGSLAMGGFHLKHSDIDIIVLTKKPASNEQKEKLAHYLKGASGQPFPIELSILTTKQVENWTHPSPFDFHFSEYWRSRFQENTAHTIVSQKEMVDPDLAAHLTILTERGRCVDGKSISDAFQLIPTSHYYSAIMGDYEDCLGSIEENPTYSILNMLRVYRYKKDQVISSKQEAGEWGCTEFPVQQIETIQKALLRCEASAFTKDELRSFKGHIMKGMND